MSVIKIKRSGVSGSPSSLGQGELAYSYLAGNEANGGDRLYIGTGVETGGNAANIEVIGGTYFTSKLDHTPGTLTANSAIIVDSNSKIDVINVDDIQINGNAITTTVTNRDLVISPNGTGSINVDNSKIINLSTPTANTDAATKAYVDSQVGSVVSNFTIAGDSGTDNFETGQTLTFIGDTGITTVVANNSVTIDLDDTAVTPGTYGSSTQIPVITVDQQGRVTNADFASISTDLDIAGDSGTDTISLATETLTFAGGDSITTVVSGNTVTINADDATTTTKGVASFDANDFNVTSGAVELEDTVVKTITTDSGALTPAAHGFSIIGGEGMDVTHSTATITIAGEDASTSNKGIASFNTANFTVTSGAVTAKDITLGSSILTLGSTTTVLAGITQLDVNNIRIDGNTISSTDTNGNIIISPDGAGSIDVGNSRIINLSTPTASSDAATKSYVDTIASASIHYHIPVRVETPSAEGSLNATYDNGNNGVGATLTANLNEVLVIDGITVDLNDRVLVYSQANAVHNGVYTLSQLGDVGTPWVLTRATDADSFGFSDPDALGTGDAFFVKEGNTGAGELYVMNTEGEITFGTTEITFVQISSAQIYVAGDGLALSGVTFNVNVDNSSIEIDTDTLRVKALGITDAMLAGSISNSKLTNSTITVAGDSGSQAIDLGDTLTVSGSTGIATSVSGDAITINLVTEAVQDIVGAFVTEGEGIDITYNDSANTLTISAEDATTSNKGVASFNSSNFTVTSGAVSIAAIDGGTY